MADRTAKRVIDNRLYEIKIPFSDFKPCITQYVNSFFQATWNKCSTNKLPRGDVGVRIRPQHPLACRKRRLNGAACLPWAATRVA